MIEIYTDGAYNPVSGEGGWAAVIVDNGQQNVFSGAVAKPTTGNRMEIAAVLEGIIRAPSGASITVYTDSQYVYGCLARGWTRRANLDLWQRLDKEVAQRKIKWEWIDQNIPNVFQKEAHNTATGLVTKNNKSSEVKTTRLSHIDEKGRPKMVNVGEKPDTEREAVAGCRVRMKPVTFALIKECKIAKGDALTTAQLAGIMGSKQTSNLIPLCHPIIINEAKVEFSLDEASSTVEITATVRSIGKTGVEMEALTAAGVAALTIYDMCKAVDRGMVISDLRLIRKSGGKSGTIELDSWD
jgi:cyclic pyranopterin monophosphate synthase